MISAGTTYQQNDLQTSLDTLSINTDGTSSADSLAAYATYGVADAAVSGVVGLYNTGVALGESLGAWDSSYKIDEGDAIKATFGQNAADFYGRHKEGIDAAGFVMSSLIPGIAAVKAFRAATGYGVLTEGMQLATGMRNAEIFTAAKQAALTAPKASLWTNPVIQRAYVAGAKQQFLEAAVFDAAVALTTNQNTFVNKEDLGYFEASWKQAVEFAPYTIGFGALGAGLEAFKIKGILTRVVGNEFKANATLATPLTESYVGIAPGNALGDIAKKAADHSTLAPKPEETFALRQFNIGQKSIENEAMAQIGKLNSADATTGDFIVEQFKLAASGDRNAAEAFDNTFAFAQNVTNVSKADMEKGVNFFTPTEAGKFPTTKSPFGIIEAETPEALQIAMQEYVTKLGAVVPEGAKISENQFIRILNERGANAPQEIKDKLIFTQMAQIKGQDNAIKASLDALLNAELKNLSHQKLSGSNRNQVLTQLINASQDAAPYLWNGVKTKNFQEAVDFLGGPIGQKISTTELLSHGGELLTNPATGEMAAQKYPALAEFLSKQGLADKPWNTNTAYLNMRTGRTSAEILPGLQDIKGVITVDAKGVHHSGIAQSFKYDAKIFALSEEKLGISALRGEEYLKYDAMWHTAATEKFKGADADKVLTVADLDYPRLQRAILEWEKAPESINQVFFGLRQFTDPKEMRKFYADEIFVRKVRLAERGINENVIAKVLHMDVEDVVGKVEVPDRLLMAEKKYDAPELVKVAYSNRPARDYQTQAFVHANVSALRTAMEEETKSAITKVLGEETLSLIPKPLQQELVGKAVGSISPQEGRTGFFTGLQNAVGGLRERVELIRKSTAKLKQNEAQELSNSVGFAASALNLKGEQAQLLRAEFANIDSLVRSGHYLQEGGYLIRKEGVQAAEAEFNALAKQIETTLKAEAKAELESKGLVGRKLSKALNARQETISRQAAAEAEGNLNAKYGEPYLIGGARALGEREVPIVVKMSPEADKIVAKFKELQDTDWEKGREVAKLRGYDSAALPNRYIQPVQPDLKRYKYNAFVVPNVFQEGSDARKFMIFAETEAEFEAKLAATQKHPLMENYKIVSTKTEVALYKKMRNEYDSDSLFHSIIYDSSQARQGHTSELVKNVDLNTSDTFERWVNHAQRRRSAITDDAIRLYYKDELATLERLELAESAFSRDILDRNLKDADSIWQDTANLYLNRRSFNGGADSLYARVNDFVGTKGSLVLDKTFDLFFKGKAPLTEEQYTRYNKRLEQLGYKNPMTDYFGTILTSPDPSVSKSLSTYMRVLSNLHSTFMLRLDFINNAMQVISSPILALPVIREVQSRLKEGELDSILRVANPAGGSEPTAAKLLALSLAEYARPTEFTKEFLGKMRLNGILTDFIQEYHLTSDFAELNGRHTAKQIDAAIKTIADHGGKWAGFNVAEEATRFMIARSVWEVARRGGYSLDDAMPIIASSVDKVHGVYADATRAGLFRGVVGQGVGLYMTYFFNLMQQFGRNLASGDRKRAGIMAAMQGSIYGIGTLPGVDLLNRKIASDFEGQDLYSLTGADSGDEFGEYMMYGLASNVWGFNVDMFSRGDLTPRHTTVVPLNPADWAVVGRTASVIGNLLDMTGNIAESLTSNTGPGVAQSLAFGLAHNGLNRPLQGLGTLIAGEVTTKSGQVLGESRGFAEDAVFSTWAARLLGSRPTAEGIAMDTMYRKTAYQAAVKDKLKSLGEDVQLQLQNGEGVMPEALQGFMKEYHSAGGDLANFNKYWSSQMRGFSQPQLEKFRNELTQDTLSRKLYYSLQ